MNRLAPLMLGVLLSGCEGTLVLFATDAGGDGPTGVVCGTGTTRCADRCVSTVIDDASCGSCGHACGASEGCAGSRCYPRHCTAMACAANQVCLDDRDCKDRTCVGVVCPGGGRCSAGTCLPASPCAACPALVHATSRCLAGACARGPCDPGYFDVDGAATPGCESTCVGLTCTLPDGTLVRLTTLPVPDTGGAGDLASSTNVGASAANATHRHVGVMGEGPGSPGVSSSAMYQNTSGLKSLQK